MNNVFVILKIGELLSGQKGDWMTIIYDPTSRPARMSLPALGAASLKGCRVGVLDNGWPSWQKVLRRYEEDFGEVHGAEGVRRWEIPLSSAAPEVVIREAASESDVVIVGLAN